MPLSDDTDHAPVSSARPRVLLTATLHWPFAARLAMAFDALGCPVEMLCRRGHPAGTTHAVRRLHRASAWQPLRALRRAIVAAAPDLVLPCDDGAAVQLAQLHAILNDAKPGDAALRVLLERSLGNPAACALATARADLLALAVLEGVRVPESAAVASVEALAAWLARHGLPAVLKVDGSWGGQGVAIVGTRAEAERAFTRLTARVSRTGALARMLIDRDASALATALRPVARGVTVQAFVDGMPANRAVACWRGRVLAGISVQALRTQHATGPATVVRVVEHPAMALAAERIVRRLGLSGLWGFDFMLEAEGQAACLIEVNPRATPICHLPLGAGHDLPAALDAVCRGAVPATAVQPGPAIAGDLVALFPGEWLRDPALADLLAGHHDRPDDEPGFVRDCLDLPWAERGLVARLRAALRRGRARPPPAQMVRHRTDPVAVGTLQPSPAPGTGTRLQPGLGGPRPRRATDPRP